MQNLTNFISSSTIPVIDIAIFLSYFGSIAQKEGEQMQYNFSEDTNENMEQSKDIQSNLCFNAVSLSGKISDATIDQNGDTLITLCVNRLSGAADIVPITVPVHLNPMQFRIGDYVTTHGIFTSYNKIVDGRSKLILNVTAQEIMPASEQDMDNPNVIELSGYICKTPIYRTTPFNREIADMLLAVNTPGISHSSSSYIPAIAWGKNARFAKNLTVGEKIQISGRIQSREYQKRLEDGTVEIRTAYEVSINAIYKEEHQA
jgi:primosomal replication protein N